MASAWGSSWASAWGGSWGAISGAAVVATVAPTGGHGRKKKHYILAEEPLPIADEPVERETAAEVLEVARAKAGAALVATEIIEQQREIARIKTQMRLTASADAMRVMESEINAIERHLSQIKRDAEDDILMILLM